MKHSCKLFVTVYLATEVDVDFELMPDGKVIGEGTFKLPADGRTAISRGVFVTDPQPPPTPMLTPAQQQTLLSYAALSVCEGVHMEAKKQHEAVNGPATFTVNQPGGKA